MFFAVLTALSILIETFLHQHLVQRLGAVLIQAPP